VTILSRIVPAHRQQDSRVKPWQLPEFDGQSNSHDLLTAFKPEQQDTSAASVAANSPTIDAEKTVEQNKGYQEGLQLAEEQNQEHLQKLKLLVNSLEESIPRINEAVAAELIGLAIEISRQILKHELSLSPDNLVSLINEAIKQLPKGEQETFITLNPEDAGFVESVLPLSDESTIKLTTDSSLESGNFVLTRGHSIINSGIDSMLQSVASRLEAK